MSDIFSRLDDADYALEGVHESFKTFEDRYLIISKVIDEAKQALFQQANTIEELIAEVERLREAKND
jgi:hypothetical protein